MRPALRTDPVRIGPERRTEPKETMSKDIDYYVAGVTGGDRLVLSRTITLIESGLAEHQKLGRQVVDRLLDRTGNAVRLGITGVPGAGKSTFIESLGLFLAERGNRVAVLAVDPSSTKSGGSILADKTRMEKLSIRRTGLSSVRRLQAARLGGVARKTRETMLVCEAAGYDVVIVETVGVGQSEYHRGLHGRFFPGAHDRPGPATSSRASRRACWRWPTHWP
jgi:LAO/AO transport system kinase